MTDNGKASGTDFASAEIERRLEEERARRAPYIAEAKTFAERRDDLMLKWYLSLAVGNGAGGIGLTSAIVNTWTKPTPQFPFVAGLWCFAVGLFAAGLIPLLRALRAERQRQLRLVNGYKFNHGAKAYVYVNDVGDMEEADTAWERHSRAFRWWDGASIGVQVVSALALVVSHPVV